ncbi:hypothetical protein PR202_gb06565 [Eleusine coracana subsp. coracana]|uniref:Uncharacterized protein n=1 Tax=Eleusine coracana subsp. coracana TaxID=191504 RepID=A0AAV5E7G6_ELECO|nr:hypothetical protein PR202_gb06565 [Eleusine coracana subsp. coracana]
MLRDAFEYYGTIVAVKVRPLPPSLWFSPVLPGGFRDGRRFDAVVSGMVVVSTQWDV